MRHFPSQACPQLECNIHKTHFKCTHMFSVWAVCCHLLGWLCIASGFEMDSSESLSQRQLVLPWCFLWSHLKENSGLLHVGSWPSCFQLKLGARYVMHRFNVACYIRLGPTFGLWHNISASVLQTQV